MIADEKIYSVGKIDRREKKTPGWYTPEIHQDIKDRCKQWVDRWFRCLPKYALISETDLPQKMLVDITHVKCDGGKDANSPYSMLYLYICGGLS